MTTYVDALRDYTIEDLNARFELLNQLIPSMQAYKQARKEGLLGSLASWVCAKENLKVDTPDYGYDVIFFPLTSRRWPDLRY